MMLQYADGNIKCIQTFKSILQCIIYIVCLLHVSATRVAILREVNYEGWIYRDITNFVNQCTDYSYGMLLHGYVLVIIFLFRC
jgi:hypothetical protein